MTLRALLVGLLVLVVAAVLGGDHDSPLWPLAGRFHPLLVHLPIGMLVLAAVAEGLGRVPSRSNWRALVSPALLIGAWSAIAAGLAGLFLADWGSYDPALLIWHKRLGVLIAPLATLAWWLRERAETGEARAYRLYPAIAGGLVLTLLVGGHLGGTLARGEGYLTRHLPEGVRSMLGMPPEDALTVIAVGNPDTTRVYHALIQPILTARCGSCHNDVRHKGGLVLTSVEGLREGGRQGKVVVPGRADDSELLLRMSLPPGHTDAMPPDRAMPVSEAALVRWWIEQGASTEVTLSMIERPSEIRRTLAAYGLEDLPTGIFALTVPVVDTATLEAARRAGLAVQPLAGSTHYLSVTPGRTAAPVATGLAALQPIAGNVAWMDLTHTEVGDSTMTLLAAMPHLSRLRLSGTKVTDAGIEQLKGLRYLEYLNLVDTDVSDAGLRALEAMPRLRAVHLWGTRATEGGVARLQRALPRAAITLGAPVMPVDSAASPSVPTTPK